MSEKNETRTVTWRLPKWVAEKHANDWSEFREVMDDWVASGKKLPVPKPPVEAVGCCMRIGLDTLTALEAEAERLSKATNRKWTAGKVARMIYENTVGKG